MTKQEAAQILAILKAAYPNSYKNMTKDEAMGTISVWAMQFSDMPADIVMLAVHKAIASSPFPPAISEVKNKLYALHWEANSLIDNRSGIDLLQQREMDAAKRIYEATEKFSRTSNMEPTLIEMLKGESYMRLSSGKKVNDREGYLK